MWAQNDDLSVFTDNDEVGFRVVEYGTKRKITVSNSVKGEMGEMKFRIAEYNREKSKSGMRGQALRTNVRKFKKCLRRLSKRAA
jgi:hypothetical protein